MLLLLKILLKNIVPIGEYVMTKFLIIYSSVDGHTQKICERMRLNLNKGNNVKIISVEDICREELIKYDFVIIGASIRYGKHRSNVYKFIKENKTLLDKIDNAFFSVNVVARKTNKSSPKNNPYIQKFLKITKWEPKHLGVFAGKIDYKKYNLIDRLMICFIMWVTKGPTNLNGAYDFTNWQRVDDFCKKLVYKICR
tara:strand:+ start:3328 stop:3918 length:591 start_codon:yes stop_codon:yes gene_type:complete